MTKNSSLKYIIIGITSTVITIITTIYIILIFNSNKPVVSDTGAYKITIFYIGMLLYFNSNLFSTYMNYKECSLYYLFRHFGIFLILFLFYFMIILNLELGMKNDTMKSKNILLKINDSENVETNDETDKSDSLINSGDNSLKPLDFKSNLMIYKKESKNIFSQYEINEKVLRRFRSINSVFIESIILYTLIFIILISLILIKIKEGSNHSNYIRNKNGDDAFIYKCPLEKNDFILNIAEFLALFLILIISDNVIPYHNIFKYVQYISHLVKIGIISGPILNVMYIIKI